MGTVIQFPNRPVRVTKQDAKDLIREAFEAGDLAISPPGVPPFMWCEAGREVGRDLHVFVQYQAAHAGREEVGILRANRGYPPNIPPYSAEAKQFRSGNAHWVDEQHLWNRLLIGRSC